MSGSLVEEARPLAIVPAVVPQPASQPGAGTPPTHDPGSQDEPGHQVPAVHQDDPDAKALAAARAEVEAEERGIPAPRQQPTAQPTRQQQATRPAQPGQAIMVPKARLDESLRAQKAASDQVAYLQGVIATLQAQGQGGTAPAAPAQPDAAQPAQQPDAAQTIEQHQAAVNEAAAKFDAGEITMTEFVKVQTEANNAIAALREASMAAPRQTIGLADAEIMAAHQAQLEQQHPWALVLSVPELQLLAEYARGEAIALGRPIGSGPAETVRLRQAVAELSDLYGPRWYPERVQEVAGVAANQNQQRQQASQPQTPARPISPAAQQGLRKIALAQSHPPNINHAGSPGNTADVYSEDRIAAMTTDEIEALPTDIRRRYLG